MRPIDIAMNATGYSPWIPIDYVEAWFGVSVGVLLSEDASGITYTVQFTLDQVSLETYQNDTYPVTISRSGTTATVTDKGPYGIGHGLSTNDSVIIKGTGSTNLDSPVAVKTSTPYGVGDIGVTVLAGGLTSTAYTYTVANSGNTADQGQVQVARLRVFNHATLASLTSRNNGSFNYPIRALRLYVSAYSAGFAVMRVLQGSAA